MAVTALNQAVQNEILSGAELESQTSTMAVLIKGKKVNHVLHLVLSLITAGLWLIVWLLLILTNKRQRVVLTLTESGGVERTVTTAR